MVFSEKIFLSTKGFCDAHNINKKVEVIVKKSKIKDGLALVFVLGSTAGVTIMEFEPNLVKDLQDFFEKVIPQDGQYHHNKTWGDGNGFSHLRASLLGPSLTVPVADGKLQLGAWQQIVFVDFDNRARNREILVQVAGE